MRLKHNDHRELGGPITPRGSAIGAAAVSVSSGIGYRHRRVPLSGPISLLLTTAVIAMISGVAHPQPVRIGVIISETGPAASLGIPQRNTVPLLGGEVAGQEVRYIVLDDGSDPEKSRAEAITLADSDKVDVIIGPSTTPAALSIKDILVSRKLTGISLAAGDAFATNRDGSGEWAFQTPQRNSLMADAIVDHMLRNGIRGVAFIGQNDAYGDDWLSLLLSKSDIHLVDVERYSRTDMSVTWQVLKAMAAKPEAILIAAAGTPAVTPQRELKRRNYDRQIYQTHGAANFDYLRVGGADVNDTILPVGPILVANQLDLDNPIKAKAEDYISAYEARYGSKPQATFGAQLYDAWLLLQIAIPGALKTAKPGSPTFRAALRTAIEQLHNVVTTQGIVSMSPTDHNGLDMRARVMVRVSKDSTWEIVK
jgi:branched-chain amino acid transport system substrate-binding protein